MARFVKEVHILPRLVRCARCGGNHRNVAFRKLRRPLSRFNFWALCPKLHEPIMMVKT